MKIILSIVTAVVLFNVPAYADDIDDAYAICLRFTTNSLPNVPRSWAKGYEHCQTIAEAKEGRDHAEEEKSINLKKTKDVFRKLKGN